MAIIIPAFLLTADQWENTLSLWCREEQGSLGSARSVTVITVMVPDNAQQHRAAQP